MASLPSQHPRLALHMTDRALTPIITSSQQSQSQTQHPRTSHPAKRATFSTSPPESPSDESSLASSTSSTSSATTAPAEEALSNLSSTALSAYDAAKRLGKGAPLRTMVEYPDGGLVVLHSYMCPMSLALGTPGRNASSTSLHTAAAGVGGYSPERAMMAGTNGDAIMMEGQQGRTAAEAGRDGSTPTLGGAARSSAVRTPTRPLSSALDPDSEGEEEEESPNAPPMLISTVVAPRAEDLREARRAAGRLERIARVFQTEWVVEGGSGA